MEKVNEQAGAEIEITEEMVAAVEEVLSETVGDGTDYVCWNLHDLALQVLKAARAAGRHGNSCIGHL